MLLNKCAILPTYSHLMQRWLNLLVDAGWLQRTTLPKAPTEIAYQCIQPVCIQPVEDQTSTARAVLADEAYVLDFVMECGQQLSGVITGKDQPVRIVIPGWIHGAG